MTRHENPTYWGWPENDDGIGPVTRDLLDALSRAENPITPGETATLANRQIQTGLGEIGIAKAYTICRELKDMGVVEYIDPQKNDMDQRIKIKLV